jgi:PKD repeat protein
MALDFSGWRAIRVISKKSRANHYNSFGSYDVTLIAKNEFSTDTLVRNKYVNVVPGMFPNPARNQVTMLLGNHGDEELKFEITDFTGRPVTAWRYKIAGLYSVNINTIGLRNGAYIITAISDDNSFSRQKLIIAR